MTSRRGWKALAATLLANGALAGCGHTQLVGDDRTVALALTEYRLSPQSVRVNAGPLTIFVHNYGRLTHNFVVSGNGLTGASTKTIWPGQSAQLALNLAPGRYTMSSSLLSDEALGAYGTLTVTS